MKRKIIATDGEGNILARAPMIAVVKKSDVEGCDVVASCLKGYRSREKRLCRGMCRAAAEKCADGINALSLLDDGNYRP